MWLAAMPPERGRTVDQGYKCISIHGGVLYFSEAEKALRAGEDINHPQVVRVIIEGNSAFFSYRDSYGDVRYVMPSNHGLTTYKSKDFIADPMRAIAYVDTYMYFEKNRFFLSCNPDGSVDFKVYMEIYERFFLLPDDSLHSSILSNDWYSQERKAVVRKSQIAIADNFRINFGGVYLSFDSLTNYTSMGDKEFSVVYDEFKIDRISLYNPAIYFSAFGREQSFTLLNMCIRSIEAHGNFDGRYLIISNRDEDYIYTLLDFIEPERLEIIAMPVIDEIDMVCARFKISGLSTIQQYQPVLYMDTDIICNSPIDNLFLEIMAGKSNIFVKAEGELSLDPYGGVLTSKDENAEITYPNVGFSTGVIGFRNTQRVKIDFESIVNCIYLQIQTGTDRHSHQVYDQPVANYYFNKLSSYDVVAVDRFIHGWPPIENDQITGKGLIHFCGGVGPMHKIDRIKSYFEHVMAPDTL
ncbi:hypothetical protein ABEV34_14010 [Methylorubrum rhodesianum]|uniref:hypothetical protein n=1 Tax=Methylorubrum rhodesianum TaxID=29427 RepID=UPI003D27248B